jgi:hypothetical protein
MPERFRGLRSRARDYRLHNSEQYASEILAGDERVQLLVSAR